MIAFSCGLMYCEIGKNQVNDTFLKEKSPEKRNVFSQTDEEAFFWSIGAFSPSSYPRKNFLLSFSLIMPAERALHIGRDSGQCFIAELLHLSRRE